MNHRSDTNTYHTYIDNYHGMVSSVQVEIAYMQLEFWSTLIVIDDETSQFHTSNPGCLIADTHINFEQPDPPHVKFALQNKAVGNHGQSDLFQGG